ncbi:MULTISPECIES: hypothetical protein [Pedobacter]|uniref:hypothetical protein n=1 Tax=Pedobacter TaxID=84567 RepID=UPI00210CAFBC|nr:MULTISPECIES: hypothetical protein [unclassified Pedobacter]
MKTNETTQQDVDNVLLMSAQQNIGERPERPVDDADEMSDYDSSEDTGNTEEDLDLDLSDDPDTDLYEDDLDALNGEDDED